MSRKRLPGDGDADRRVDDPAIAELLDSVREARTSLAIELSAAAGAIEAGRPEVARDIVAATAEEMRRVSDRTDAARTRPGTPRPATSRGRLRSRRALLALPAIPLVGAVAMTAAVALGGTSAPKPHPQVAAQHHVVHVAIPQVASTTVAHQAATTTLHQLEHVVTHHPQAAQVIAVADSLHDQLTAMIATATNDPARLHVVRRLLMLEQHVLEASKVPGTQLALAASRAIARLLEDVPATKHAQPFEQPSTSTSAVATPQPATTTATKQAPQDAPSSTSSASPTSQSSDTARKNALFGRGLFTHH